jgi:two-component system CheB/CheR fusion protein
MAASAPDDSTRVVTGKRAGGALGFPIVGIGASAGGLEAFEGFFRACPADTGMGFVLVPHLDPDHVSLLTEILQRSTTMPVLEALDRVAVAPNHVYIIPPNREMGILDGELQVHLPEQPRGQRMPIDGFLRALAKDQAERAIGIVLSGTATDGTLGLRAIIGAGGVCLVQDPASARYDGMPQSAIAAGYATHILPVEAMPAMLLQLTRQSAYRLSLPSVASPSKPSAASTRSCCNCAAPPATTFRSTRKAPSAAASSGAWCSTTSTIWPSTRAS